MINKRNIAIALTAITIGILLVTAIFFTSTINKPLLNETLHNPSLNTPIFSHTSGFYPQQFYLNLSGANQDQTIRFTLDGSTPTANSQIFTDPIRIFAAIPTWANSPMTRGAHPGPLPRLYYNGMVVRARIFCQDNYGSDTVTQSFFVEQPNTGRGNFNMQVVSISIEPEYFGLPYGMYPMYNSDIRHMSHVEIFYPNGTPMLSQYAQLRVAGNWSRREQQKSLRLNFNHGCGIIDYVNLIPDTFRGFYAPLEPVTRFRHATLRTADLHNTTMREALVDRVTEPLRPENQNAIPAAVFINGEFWGTFCMREHRGRTFIAERYPEINPNSVTMLDFSWNRRNSGDHSNCTYQNCHHVQEMPQDILYPLNPCLEGVHEPEGPFGPWLDQEGRLSRAHPLFRAGLSEGEDESFAYRSWMRMYNAIIGGRVYCDSCMEEAIMPAQCDTCLYGLEMSNNEDFEIAMQFVCFDNLVDFFIAYFHFDNWDWPGNNVVTWKTSNIYPNSPIGDGKWRFVIHDFDNSIGSGQSSMINTFTTPGTNRTAGTWYITDESLIPYYHCVQPVWAVTKWQRIFESEIFRNALAARYATYVGTVFNPARVNHLIDILQAEREADIAANLYRWNKQGGSLNYSTHNWLQDVNHLREFSNSRGRYAINHIRHYFNRHDRPHLGLNLPLGDTTINWVTDTTMGFFDIAGAEIRPDLFVRDGVSTFSPDDFRGIYLRGLPIEVTARPFSGYRFSHFIVDGASSMATEDNRLTITATTADDIITVTAVFERS